MTKLHAVYLSVCAVLLIGLMVAGIAYEVKTVRAEEQQKASDKVIAAKDQALSDRDKAFAELKAQKLQEISDIKTIRQALVALQPVTQGAVPQTVTKADLSPAVQQQLPGDPNTHYTLYTDEQVINAAKREKSCELTEAGLTKCDADKQDMQAKIDQLTKANAQWQKAGKVGPWIAGLGAAKNADGKGYTPAMLFGRRITSNLGIMAGVQGRGDLSLWATWNFGK